MNEALYNLYKSKWSGLTTVLDPIHDNNALEIKPSNPLLLYVDDEEGYKAADIRLMVFGQETNGWFEREDGTIEGIQHLYHRFFNQNGCWNYGGQFWNGVSRLLHMLKTKFPNKKVRLIWNNIVKIGRHGDKGFPPGYIYKIEREYFHVIPDEVKILQPTVVVFFTGPNYDRVISDNFGSIKYEALPFKKERQLSRVLLPGIPFAYRTYHPNYLWRNDIDEYLKAILNDLEF